MIELNYFVFDIFSKTNGIHGAEWIMFFSGHHISCLLSCD
jgi:hypothetical protein